MTIFFYTCPECNMQLGPQIERHQHSNGEWIETVAVKAAFFIKRWDKLHEDNQHRGHRDRPAPAQGDSDGATERPEVNPSGKGTT